MPGSTRTRLVLTSRRLLLCWPRCWAHAFCTTNFIRPNLVFSERTSRIDHRQGAMVLVWPRAPVYKLRWEQSCAFNHLEIQSYVGKPLFTRARTVLLRMQLVLWARTWLYSCRKYFVVVLFRKWAQQHNMRRNFQVGIPFCDRLSFMNKHAHASLVWGSVDANKLVERFLSEYAHSFRLQTSNLQCSINSELWFENM